jgi:hypothetical protein
MLASAGLAVRNRHTLPSLAEVQRIAQREGLNG